MNMTDTKIFSMSPDVSIYLDNVGMFVTEGGRTGPLAPVLEYIDNSLAALARARRLLGSPALPGQCQGEAAQGSSSLVADIVIGIYAWEEPGGGWQGNVTVVDRGDGMASSDVEGWASYAKKPDPSQQGALSSAPPYADGLLSKLGVGSKMAGFALGNRIDLASTMDGQQWAHVALRRSDLALIKDAQWMHSLTLGPRDLLELPTHHLQSISNTWAELDQRAPGGCTWVMVSELASQDLGKALLERAVDEEGRSQLIKELAGTYHWFVAPDLHKVGPKPTMVGGVIPWVRPAKAGKPQTSLFQADLQVTIRVEFSLNGELVRVVDLAEVLSDPKKIMQGAQSQAFFVLPNALPGLHVAGLLHRFPPDAPVRPDANSTHCVYMKGCLLFASSTPPSFMVPAQKSIVSVPPAGHSETETDVGQQAAPVASQIFLSNLDLVEPNKRALSSPAIINELTSGLQKRYREWLTNSMDADPVSYGARRPLSRDQVLAVRDAMSGKKPQAFNPKYKDAFMKDQSQSYCSVQLLRHNEPALAISVGQLWKINERKGSLWKGLVRVQAIIAMEPVDQVDQAVRGTSGSSFCAVTHEPVCLHGSDWDILNLRKLGKLIGLDTLEACIPRAIPAIIKLETDQTSNPDETSQAPASFSPGKVVLPCLTLEVVGREECPLYHQWGYRGRKTEATLRGKLFCGEEEIEGIQLRANEATAKKKRDRELQACTFHCKETPLPDIVKVGKYRVVWSCHPGVAEWVGTYRPAPYSWPFKLTPGPAATVSAGAVTFDGQAGSFGLEWEDSWGNVCPGPADPLDVSVVGVGFKASSIQVRESDSAKLISFEGGGFAAGTQPSCKVSCMLAGKDVTCTTEPFCASMPMPSSQDTNSPQAETTAGHRSPLSSQKAKDPQPCSTPLQQPQSSSQKAKGLQSGGRLALPSAPCKGMRRGVAKIVRKTQKRKRTTEVPDIEDDYSISHHSASPLDLPVEVPESDTGSPMQAPSMIAEAEEQAIGSTEEGNRCVEYLASNHPNKEMKWVLKWVEDGAHRVSGLTSFLTNGDTALMAVQIGRGDTSAS